MWYFQHLNSTLLVNLLLCNGIGTDIFSMCAEDVEAVSVSVSVWLIETLDLSVKIIISLCMKQTVIFL